uniref:Lipoxygenase domain-containing protein n=1 Tax=Physcomitrium patens TaxID=3218 RepID=A0A2K1L9J5_PHYPA|nr:hypothetical protein PHYPA_001131 [Physcomitrium patens]
MSDLLSVVRWDFESVLLGNESLLYDHGDVVLNGSNFTSFTQKAWLSNKALRQNRLFVLDYRERLLGYIQRINDLKSTQAYAAQMLRTHAMIEPFIAPFKNSKDINQSARKSLICALGIVEHTFTPYKYDDSDCWVNLSKAWVILTFPYTFTYIYIYIYLFIIDK